MSTNSLEVFGLKTLKEIMIALGYVHNNLYYFLSYRIKQKNNTYCKQLFLPFKSLEPLIGRIYSFFECVRVWEEDGVKSPLFLLIS